MTISQAHEYALILTLLCVPILWLGASMAVSKVSGWSALAKLYRAKQPFAGNKLYLQSAHFKWLGMYGSFNGVLTVGANPTGLYLGLLLPFRFGAPPVFIPWRAIQSSSTTWLLRPNYVRLSFVGAPKTSFIISRVLAEKLHTRSSGAFSIPEAT